MFTHRSNYNRAHADAKRTILMTVFEILEGAYLIREQ
jgi:hypothetical protein